jgi:hypothetical protein
MPRPRPAVWNGVESAQVDTNGVKTDAKDVGSA